MKNQLAKTRSRTPRQSFGELLFFGALSALTAAFGAGLTTSTAEAHPYGAPHLHPHAGGGFVKLGQRVVADGFDRDEIALPGRDRVLEVKLCVRRRAVEFLDFDIRFANGGNQDVNIRRVIGPGQCTRNIKLRGAPRNVRKIVMKYTALRKRGNQPIVEVFARGAVRGATGPRRRFVLVGSRVVADNFDRDTVALRGAERAYQIKLCVRRRAVEFLDLDVRFANRRNQDIPVRRVIGPGQCTRNINLRGAPRNIAKIVMKYTALRKRGRQPIVDVYIR